MHLFRNREEPHLLLSVMCIFFFYIIEVSFSCSGCQLWERTKPRLRYCYFLIKCFINMTIPRSKTFYVKCINCIFTRDDSCMKPHMCQQIILAALKLKFWRNGKAFLQVLKTPGIEFFGYTCFEASTEDLKSRILCKNVVF